MPYKFLEEIGIADIAFEAVGRDLPELFRDAADATMNVMIDNLDAFQNGIECAVLSAVSLQCNRRSAEDSGHYSMMEDFTSAPARRNCSGPGSRRGSESFRQASIFY